MDDTTTWQLIHTERAALADTLAALPPEAWTTPSLCAGWSVRQAAGHVVAGAEQTTRRFVGGLVAAGFRFDTMIDRAAQRAGAATPEEIVARLRARTATTNRPPAPVMTMLGEVVVHALDIGRPLALPVTVAPEALQACLAMFVGANFPVGAKRRVAGLRLAADDVTWTHGDGPTVQGDAASLLLAICGRAAGLDDLRGDGLATLRSRFALSAA